MVKKIIQIALIFCIFSVSKMAAAGPDLILEKSFFQDSQKSLQFDQIREKKFESFSGVFNRGYGNTFYWFKLKIQTTDVDQTLLRILPTFLDEIEVYIPQKNGSWLIKKTGDRSPFSERDFAYTSFVIDLKNAPAKELIIYVKLSTASTNLIHFEALKSKTLAENEIFRDMGLGIYFGLLLMFIAWSIHGTIKHKNMIIAAFGAFELVEVLYALSLMGYLSRFFLPENPLLADFITSFTVISHIFFGFLFHSTFIHSLPINRWSKWLQHGLTSFYVGLQAGFLLGYKQECIILANFLILPSAFNMIWVAIATYRSKIVMARGIAVVYVCLFISVLASITPYLGLIQAAEASLYAPLFNSLISSILLYTLLHRREQVLQDQLQIALNEARFEKQQHLQQSRFMAMLTHEIKTPLAALRLTVGSLLSPGKLYDHAEVAIKDIDQIIERCRQADQLEQKQMMAKMEIIHTNDMLKIIDKYSSPFVKTRCDVLEATPIMTDRFIFEIVLSNLIENAKKYAPAKSDIHIEISEHSSHLGHGIDIRIQNLIGKAGAPNPDTLFKKYHREEGAHNTSGSGLGLFIIKSCVDILGGKIEYRQHPSKVEFHLWLP
jgi:signal transduction histidine kinase